MCLDTLNWLGGWAPEFGAVAFWIRRGPRNLPELLGNGSISQSRLDDAVRNVLRAKAAMGLFANPYKTLDPSKEWTKGQYAELQEEHDKKLLKCDSRVGNDSRVGLTGYSFYCLTAFRDDSKLAWLTAFLLTDCFANWWPWLDSPLSIDWLLCQHVSKSAVQRQAIHNLRQPILNTSSCSSVRASQQLFETSATALCGTTGICVCALVMQFFHVFTSHVMSTRVFAGFYKEDDRLGFVSWTNLKYGKVF